MKVHTHTHTRIVNHGRLSYWDQHFDNKLKRKIQNWHCWRILILDQLIPNQMNTHTQIQMASQWEAITVDITEPVDVFNLRIVWNIDIIAHLPFQQTNKQKKNKIQFVLILQSIFIYIYCDHDNENVQTAAIFK